MAYGIPHDVHALAACGELYGVDPGAAGTFALNNKCEQVFICAGAGDARVLPAEDQVPLGATLYVVNNGTGTLTVNDDGSTAIITLPAGEAARLMLGESDETRFWGAILYEQGLTVT